MKSMTSQSALLVPVTWGWCSDSRNNHLTIRYPPTYITRHSVSWMNESWIFRYNNYFTLTYKYFSYHHVNIDFNTILSNLPTLFINFQLIWDLTRIHYDYSNLTGITVTESNDINPPHQITHYQFLRISIDKW